MQRLLVILIVLFGVSCEKRRADNPLPVVTFKDFKDPKKSEFTGADTATMVLTYSDGDGDLFVDDNTQGPNLIFTSYYWDKATSTFKANYSNVLKDTIRYGNTILQPDRGYYKGKSIRGEIYVPLSSFRADNTQSVIKFTGFMRDLAGHKSETFSSPSYTLHF